MNFAFSEHFWWFLLLPLLFFLFFRVEQRSQSIIPTFFKVSEIVHFRPKVKMMFRSIAVFFACIALVGPYYESSPQLVPVAQKELIFLLDVSSSMNCEDIKPSRLKKAKNDIEKIINKLQGFKMGLVVFTSFPYVQAPITNDPKALLLFLELLETNQFANTGTDFRKALLKTADRFSPDSLVDNASKIIVLISDGEHFGEKYQSVIEQLKVRNIKVYTVGIGTNSGAKVPKPEGGFYTLKDGTVAISKLQSQSLKWISAQFNTPYFEISSPQHHLNGLVEHLEKEKFVVLGQEEQVIEANLFQWFLLPAIIFLFLSLIMIPHERK